VAIEIVVAAAALALFAVTYWMFWAGLAGTGRLLWLKRCPHCGHLRVTTDLARYQVSECSYCRHPWVSAHLLHNRLRHNFHREW
jgi:hypothetical protein